MYLLGNTSYKRNLILKSIFMSYLLLLCYGCSGSSSGGAVQSDDHSARKVTKIAISETQLVCSENKDIMIVNSKNNKNSSILFYNDSGKLSAICEEFISLANSYFRTSHRPIDGLYATIGEINDVVGVCLQVDPQWGCNMKSGFIPFENLAMSLSDFKTGNMGELRKKMPMLHDRKLVGHASNDHERPTYLIFGPSIVKAWGASKGLPPNSNGNGYPTYDNKPTRMEPAPVVDDSI